MGMGAFFELFRDVAERETRSLIVMNDDKAVPNEEYGLTEWYCVDPNCDCRRVLIKAIAVRQREEVATISYAFEPPKDELDEQIFLDPLHPQAPFARALLDLFENVVLTDKLYVARLERHYLMVKRFIADPDDPRARKYRREDAQGDAYAVFEAVADGTFTETVSRGTFTAEMMSRPWVPARKGQRRARRRER